MPRPLILVTLASLAQASLAQAEPPPPSCETVTTVRCTGATAPLALPGAPRPASAPVPTDELPPIPELAPEPVAPPIPPLAPRIRIRPPAPQADDDEVPSCCAAPPAPAPPPSALPALPLTGGWRLTVEDGRAVLVRKRHAPVGGVWGPGLVLWLGSWVGGTIAGATHGEPWTASPFLGSFASGVIGILDGDVGRGLGYTAAGILQASGFVMFLVGLSAGDRLEKFPIQVTPLAGQGFGGASLSARF